MLSAWKKLGVKSLLRQVPAQPIFAAGSYLHAKLAWHLGTVCRVTMNVCFIEARSLISNALTWNKQSSELFTQSLAELVRVLGRGVCASSHSNAVSASGMREHPILWRRMTLASACLLVLRRVEGAPETLMGASNHSSTFFPSGGVFFLSDEGAPRILRVVTRALI